MTKKSADATHEIGLQMSLAPKRLFNRREAAQYMGLSLRKFDETKRGIRNAFTCTEVHGHPKSRYHEHYHGQSPVRSFRVPQEIR